MRDVGFEFDMGWLDVFSSVGWIRLIFGVSFLKIFKRKIKIKVCSLDLEETRDF